MVAPVYSGMLHNGYKSIMLLLWWLAQSSIYILKAFWMAAVGLNTYAMGTKSRTLFYKI